MPVDFSKWAVVARKDNTGFGRQAQDAKNVLGIGYHFVCPSDRIAGRPVEGSHEFALPRDLSEVELRVLLSKVEGILFFENYATWHPALLKVAKEIGVKTVCVANWEWFNGSDSEWNLCSLIACPTHFTSKVVQGYGWKNTTYIPWAVDLRRFTPRRISGPARLFIHNAGLVDPDDRKGTLDAINAFKRVKRDDVRLIVRMQKEIKLPTLDSRIEVRVGDLANPEDLYSTGDVAIQPSKMEGIGFMVIEPVCTGMPVITINYPPMNEFVLQPEMLTKLQWFKRKAFPTAWIKHAHLRLPHTADLAKRIEWCAQADLEPISLANRRHAESLFDPVQLRTRWEHCLGSL